MEILMALRLKEIRPIELQKELYPKFKSAQKWPLLTEEVFRTQLNRKLKKLTKEEEVIRTPKEHQDVRYSISPKGDKRILASDMASLIMMDKDSLNVFGNRIKEMRSEGKMPECFCFAFIGDVPVVFTKSEEGFKRHLAEVNYFFQRHWREIDRITQEVDKSHPNMPHLERMKIAEKRIRQEVGWSLGDFLRGLLKQAHNKEFLETMKILFEITPEENPEGEMENRNEDSL